jgi:integrase
MGLNIKNVAAGVAKPKEPKGRERRLEEDEEHLLLGVLSASENHWIKPLMEFAIETGMRRGELLKLRWEDVNLGRKTALIKETKNGDSRKIPLSVAAIRTLSGLPRHLGGNVFPVTPNALRGVWRRAAKKVRIDNLRFHDLRHEATSRLFEKGLNVMEVATITGHKDLKMLQRYTHLRAEDLAKKLG